MGYYFWRCFILGIYFKSKDNFGRGLSKKNEYIDLTGGLDHSYGWVTVLESVIVWRVTLNFVINDESLITKIRFWVDLVIEYLLNTKMSKFI